MNSTRLNLDELYETKKKKDLSTITTFNKILGRIHNSIKVTSRQKNNNEYCWYVVPEILLGIPRYNIADCIVYVVHELTDNGLKVLYTHPNLLFICWGHWIPDYVRHEYKRHTGVTIDGNGIEQAIVPQIKKTSIFKSTDSYRPTGNIYRDVR